MRRKRSPDGNPDSAELTEETMRIVLLHACGAADCLLEPDAMRFPAEGGVSGQRYALAAGVLEITTVASDDAAAARLSGRICPAAAFMVVAGLPDVKELCISMTETWFMSSCRQSALRGCPSPPCRFPATRRRGMSSRGCCARKAASRFSPAEQEAAFCRHA